MHTYSSVCLVFRDLHIHEKVYFCVKYWPIWRSSGQDPSVERNHSLGGQKPIEISKLHRFLKEEWSVLQRSEKTILDWVTPILSGLEDILLGRWKITENLMTKGILKIISIIYIIGRRHARRLNTCSLRILEIFQRNLCVQYWFSRGKDPKFHSMLRKKKWTKFSFLFKISRHDDKSTLRFFQGHYWVYLVRLLLSASHNILTIYLVIFSWGMVTQILPPLTLLKRFRKKILWLFWTNFPEPLMMLSTFCFPFLTIAGK